MLSTAALGWRIVTRGGMNNTEGLRGELIATMRTMNAQGINQGKTGNGSVREDEGFLVTPAAIPYELLTPDDIVAMNFKGEWECSAGRRPSSEWRFHRDLLQGRPEINAVLHTHGRAVTTLACMKRSIPAFHYMVAIAGGNDIRCADYATFGTQALSDFAQQALEGRKACLLAHHGLITLGTSLSEAYAIAVEVEHLADVYWRTLQLGDPEILDDAEMEVVLARFRAGYQRSQD